MADSVPTQSDSSQKPGSALPNLAGLWKLGKTFQAMTYRRQLARANRNADLLSGAALDMLKPMRQAEEDGVINVDSPTTINHHHAAAPSSLGTLGKVALAFAVSGPIGAGIAALPFVKSLFTQGPSETDDTDADSSTPAVPAPNPQLWFDLRLGEPDQ